MFRQDCTCLVLLFVAHGFVVSSTGLSPSLARLSRLFHYHSSDYHDWAVPLSLATTKGISVDFFFLRLLRCFNSPGSLYMPMYSA